MSAPARCIAVGVLVFLYWAAAFSSAVFAFNRASSADAWLAPDWLVGPGYFVGRPCLDLLRSLAGHNNLYAPGSPGCLVLLLVAAASMGTRAWLLAALLAGWRGRHRNRSPG